MMENCVNFYMRKANRVLNRIYDEHLKPCGLTVGQFSVMKVIENRKQTTNRELQDVLVIDQTTLTRGLKRLIRDGYIQVRPGKDLRVKMLSLSPEGEILIRRAMKYWRRAQCEVKKGLGNRLTQQLFTMTDAVSNLRR